MARSPYLTLPQMNNAQQINQDSGNVEYYTPEYITSAARDCMGGIDLDPASCIIANQTIKAETIYTIEDDGLKQEWFGRVWMNHPFSKLVNARWINKLVAEFESGRVSQACCICFASTSEAWFRPLLEYPQCFFYKRTNYLTPDGAVKTGATKGSVVTYLGENVDAFAKSFITLGQVKIPYPNSK